MEFSAIIKRKLTEADWFLIVANLLPVYGVWFLGWNAKQIFLVYCLETIIIGMFTLIKLGIATAVRKKDWWENQGSRTLMHGTFFMLFFLLHYGLFVGIQMSLFLEAASMGNENTPAALQLILHPFRYTGPHGWLILSVFIFGYGYENLSGFIMYNQYRTKSFMRIMFEPYLRIFVQQFAVICGEFFMALGGGKFFILIFVAVKIFFTVFLNYHNILNKTIRKEAFLRKQ